MKIIGEDQINFSFKKNFYFYKIYKENGRFSSAKRKTMDIFKEIDEERKDNHAFMKTIWEEFTQNKNSLELLIEISLNSDYQEKIHALQFERINLLKSLCEEIKKIIQEKLNSIQVGLCKKKARIFHL